MKVCVDPGHGMSNRTANVYDPGATHQEGATRHEEATIALRYGLSLKDAFRARGVSVFMTRDDASDHAPVGRRAQAARDAGCDVFISLHMNDVDDNSAHGTETLYRGPQDRAFAARILQAVLRVTQLRDRGVKERNDLAVLRFQGTAVLIEMGFIANDGDRGKILEPQTRDAVCEAVASATMAHMGWEPGPLAAPAAIPPAFAPEVAAIEDDGNEPGEHDWGGGAREAYDLNQPLIADPAAALTVASFTAAFGAAGVPADFAAPSFEQLVRSWNLRHFAPAEFLFLGSAHYAPGACHGRNSLPQRSLWERLENTARMIDEIRERFGHPIKIISAYRNDGYNDCVGGKGGSLHRAFNALDFTNIGGTLREMYAIALHVRNSASRFEGGIGYYPGSRFVHIDTRGRRADW